MDDAVETYSCTLTPGQADARALDDRALAARVEHSERLEAGVRVTFAGGRDTRRLVDSFVRNERQCCAFFDFAVEERDDLIALEITAPPDESAQQLVDMAQRAFDAAAGASDHGEGDLP